ASKNPIQMGTVSFSFKSLSITMGVLVNGSTAKPLTRISRNMTVSFLATAHPPQRVLQTLGYLYVDQFSYQLGTSGEIDDPVTPRPPRHILRGISAAPLYQYLPYRSLQCFVLSQCYSTLELLKALQAPLFFRRRAIVFPLGSLRSLAGGIFKGKKPVKLHRLHELQGLIEVRLLFGWEAHHDIRGDAALWRRLSQSLYLNQVLLPRMTPVHPREHAVGSRLKGEMKMLAEMLHSSKGLDGLLREIPGMGG